MTLDELIAAALDAKALGVPGDSDVLINGDEQTTVAQLRIESARKRRYTNYMGRTYEEYDIEYGVTGDDRMPHVILE